MVTKVQKWGNSLGLRIPKAMAKKAHIASGTAVDLTVAGERLLIQPVRRKQYTLRELVSRITPENRHEEIDFGPPVGRELI